MNLEIEKARREFLSECDIVARAPLSVLCDGDFKSNLSKLIPVSSYVYVGVIKAGATKHTEIKAIRPEVHFGLAEVKDYHVLDYSESPIFRVPLSEFRDTDYTFWTYADKVTLKKLGYPAIKKVLAKLPNYGLKIWIECPASSVFTIQSAVSSCVSLVIHFLVAKNIAVSKFNKEWYESRLWFDQQYIIDVLTHGYPSGYKSGIVWTDQEIEADKEELSKMAGYVDEYKKSRELFRNIFILAWQNDLVTNGAGCITALMGGFLRHKPAKTITYRIPVWEQKSLQDSILKHTGSEGNVLMYLKDMFNSRAVQVFSDIYGLLNSDILVINAKNAEADMVNLMIEKGLIDKQKGSDLPENFSIRQDERRDHFIEEVHCRDGQFLVIDSAQKLARLQDECKCFGWVHYSSLVSGWSIEGARLLEESEFKRDEDLAEISDKVSSLSSGNPKDYLVILSNANGFGVRDPITITGNKISEFIPENDNPPYDLIVFNQTVRKKVGIKTGKKIQEKHTLVNLPQPALRLLLLLLRNKDHTVSAIDLYHKLFEFSLYHDDQVKTGPEASEKLKKHFTKLRSEFVEDINGFELPYATGRARKRQGGDTGYVLTGNFSFCLIYPPAEDQKYIL